MLKIRLNSKRSGPKRSSYDPPKLRTTHPSYAHSHHTYTQVSLNCQRCQVATELQNRESQRDQRNALYKRTPPPRTTPPPTIPPPATRELARNKTRSAASAVRESANSAARFAANIAAPIAINKTRAAAPTVRESAAAASVNQRS